MKLTLKTIKANRKKWIKALRSGKYRQIQSELRQAVADIDGEPVGYCCLGVALEACRSWKRNKSNKADLCDNVLAELGLSNQQQITLINCNDEYNYGFEAIATRIEKMPIHRA